MFEHADGGTIFMDEIGELSLMQLNPKLLAGFTKSGRCSGWVR